MNWTVATKTFFTALLVFAGLAILCGFVAGATILGNKIAGDVGATIGWFSSIAVAISAFIAIARGAL
jgi:hypothetical protein